MTTIEPKITLQVKEIPENITPDWHREVFEVVYLSDVSLNAETLIDSITDDISIRITLDTGNDTYQLECSNGEVPVILSTGDLVTQYLDNTIAITKPGNGDTLSNETVDVAFLLPEYFLNDDISEDESSISFEEINEETANFIDTINWMSLRDLVDVEESRDISITGNQINVEFEVDSFLLSRIFADLSEKNVETRLNELKDILLDIGWTNVEYEIELHSEQEEPEPIELDYDPVVFVVLSLTCESEAKPLFISRMFAGVH